MDSSANPARAARHTVAVHGFSGFEREALAAYFRLAARRDPAFHQVDSIALADFVVADADRADAVRDVLAAGRLADTVFVGARPPPAATACIMRPLAVLELERTLDALAGARPAPAAPVAGAGTVDLLLADLGLGAPGTGAQAAAAPAGGGRAVLVVDGSGVARKFLAGRLSALGYTTQLAADVDEALERLADGTFAVVFTEVEFEPAGQSAGLALCREIKHGAHGTGAPAVVIVSGRQSAEDRVRGSLAGADGYVAKPLAPRELEATLRRVDPLFGGAPQQARRSARRERG